MLHQRKNYVLAIFTAILLWGGTAIGQTNTWIGPDFGFWQTNANWSLGIQPTAVHDVIINTSGTITFFDDEVAGTLTISDNADVTLALNTNANYSLTLSAAGTTLDVQSGSSLTVTSLPRGGFRTFSLLFAPGAGIANIAGNLNVNQSNDANSDLGIYNADNSVTSVTGTLTNNGGTIISTVANLAFGATGNYVHAINGGTVPTASWNAGSTATITGMTSTFPLGMGQTFSNLTFASALTAGIEFNSDLLVNGNLTIDNTGLFPLGLTNGATNRSIIVGGNFIFSNLFFNVVSGTGSGTINVGGNFIQNAGVFTLKDGDGTAALNITGSFIKTSGGDFRQRFSGLLGGSTVTVGGNFSHSNGGSYFMTHVAAPSTLNIAGNYTHTGGVIEEVDATTGNGNIVFTGSGTHIFTSGGTVNGLINYTSNQPGILQMADAFQAVTGDGSFTLQSNGTLGIRSPDGITATGGGAVGNIQVTGTRNFPAGGRYLYNSTTGAQVTGSGLPATINGGRLIISNPSGVTLNTPTTVTGSVIELVSGVFAATTNLTLNGAASNITRSNGSMTVTTLGGTGDYNIQYTGTAKTTTGEFIGGQAIPVRVASVSVNMTGPLTMGAGVAILGVSGSAIKTSLTLTNGLINTGLTNGLLLLDNATITGASPAKYINGPLAKIGTAAFVFPVGNNGLYLPVAISGGSAAPGDFTTPMAASNVVLVTPNRADPTATYGLATPPLSVSNCNWWDITQVVAGSPVFVWLSIDQVKFCAPDPGTALVTNAGLVVSQYTGGAWTNQGQGAAGVVAAGASSFIGTAAGLTGFSPFTLGSTTESLPVVLTGFTAAKNGNAIDLSWNTESEQNSAYFNVERSADGVNFAAIGKVNSAGNSTQTIKYKFTDNSPLAGRNYYRLRQVDLDGQFALSSIVSVNMSVNSSSVSLYPNPVLNQAQVQYPKAVKGAAYKIVSMDGRVMQSGILQENSTQMNITMGGLKSGVYVLIINNNGEQYQQRIQKQ